MKKLFNKKTGLTLGVFLVLSFFFFAGVFVRHADAAPSISFSDLTVDRDIERKGIHTQILTISGNVSSADGEYGYYNVDLSNCGSIILEADQDPSIGITGSSFQGYTATYEDPNTFQLKLLPSGTGDFVATVTLYHLDTTNEDAVRSSCQWAIAGGSDTFIYKPQVLGSYDVSVSLSSIYQGDSFTVTVDNFIDDQDGDPLVAGILDSSENISFRIDGSTIGGSVENLSGADPSASFTVGPGGDINTDNYLSAGARLPSTSIDSILSSGNILTVSSVFDHFEITALAVSQGNELRPTVRAIDKADNTHSSYSSSKNLKFLTSAIDRKGEYWFGDVTIPTASFSSGTYTPSIDLLATDSGEALAGTYTVGVEVDGGSDDDFTFSTTILQTLNEITVANESEDQGSALTVDLTGTDMAGDNFTGSRNIKFNLSEMTGAGLSDVTNSVSFSGGTATSQILDAEGTKISAGTYSGITAEYTENTSVNDTFNITINSILDSIEIFSDDTSIVSEETATYSVEATDLAGDTKDVTSTTSYSISGTDGGSWVGGVYISCKKGNWIVTAEYIEGGRTRTDTKALEVTTGDAKSLSASVATVTAGGEATVSITNAQDNCSNTIDGDYNIVVTILDGETEIYNSGTISKTFSNGAASYTTIDITTNAAASYSVEVTIDDGDDTTTFMLQPAVADYFEITGDTTGTAGVGQEVTITAYDEYDNTVSFGGNNYTGAKTLTFSGLGIATDGNTPTVSGTNLGTGTSITFTNSTATETLIPYEAETGATLNVADGGVDSSTEGNGLTLTIKHNTPTSLRITGNTTIITGDEETITITAHDAYGNVADGANEATPYAGSKTLTFSGPIVSPDGDDMPTVSGEDIGGETTAVFSEGTIDLSFYAYKAEIVDLDVTDNSINSSTEGHELGLTVKHDNVSSLRITGDDEDLAGQTFDLVIRAYDTYGNLMDGANGATAYTGDKGLIFNGPSDSPKENTPTFDTIDIGSETTITFTNGVSETVSLVPYKAETIDVDVTDGSVGSTNDDSHDLEILVKHLTTDAFRVEITPEEPTVGQSTDLKITAIDIYGNTVNGIEDGTTAFTGQVYFDTTDGSEPSWRIQHVLFNVGHEGVRDESSAVAFNSVETGKTIFAYLTDLSITGTSETFDVVLASDSTTEITVTNTALVKRVATKNGEFNDGWMWVLDVTVPTASTILNMSFDNLTGAGTINATNIRFYSAQSSDHTSSDPIVITAAGAGTQWSDDMTLDTDMDGDPSNGRQIQITVQAAVPEGSTSGAYSASYDIQASSLPL